MAHDKDPPQPIPASWRKKVASILRSSDKGKVIVHHRPRVEFEARFPNAWPYDRNEAMASALDDPAITGKQIFGMREDGEVWAFWFTFQRVRLYGKINLTSGGEIIIIYSAHVPNKGDKHL